MRYVEVHNDEEFDSVTLIPLSKIDRVELRFGKEDKVISGGLVYIPEVNDSYFESIIDDRNKIKISK